MTKQHATRECGACGTLTGAMYGRECPMCGGYLLKRGAF